MIKNGDHRIIREVGKIWRSSCYQGGWEDMARRMGLLNNAPQNNQSMALNTAPPTKKGSL